MIKIWFYLYICPDIDWQEKIEQVIGFDRIWLVRQETNRSMVVDLHRNDAKVVAMICNWTSGTRQSILSLSHQIHSLTFCSIHFFPVQLWYLLKVLQKNCVVWFKNLMLHFQIGECLCFWYKISQSIFFKFDFHDKTLSKINDCLAMDNDN